MKLIELKVRLKRLRYMLAEKGIFPTFNFLFFAATYNNEFVGNLLFSKLYPYFVFCPRYFEIEVTTRCHLRCIMCESTYWKENPHDMKLDEFKRIINQFDKLSWIGTSGIGTTFLNKDYLNMLRYAKQERKNIYIETFDSFTILNEDIIDAIVKEKLIDRFILSCDGATKQTYEKIRVGGNFDKVAENVRMLVSTKRKYNTDFPEFSAHFIVSRENYKEVPQFVEWFTENTGGDNIGILFTNLLHSFKEVKELAYALPEEMKRQAVSVGTRLGTRIMFNKNTKKKKPYRECTEWMQPYIFSDGSVIPCCAANEANRRQFQIKTRMGNILRQDFSDIWNGPKFRGVRDMLHRNEIPETCVDCPIYGK